MKDITSIESALESVFSWLFLASISIITSGWFLAHPISQTIATEQKFVINLLVLKIQATGSQVILGFSGFIITTLLSGVIAGEWIYELVKTSFGIDPGQFKSICMFSSFLTVAWSFLFFIIYYCFNANNSNFVDDKELYEDLLGRLSSSQGENDGK
ncbi:hypothetical protein [Photobacterium leiognathi]|uniref:hypothetical protein n=1 Tax=Photobacterium leiognathi TaxID=553611 RepID=UPI002980F08F|nr:hypothetical protein [Photobacterium leiognathi]